MKFNKLTKTPYLVLFIVLLTIGIGTAYGLLTITLAGDVIITGDTKLEGKLLDTSNDAGTSGQVLSSTGTGIDWIDDTGTNGSAGISCWDLNENGTGDDLDGATGDEDVNEDNVVDVLDCRGQPCWDLNNNGIGDDLNGATGDEDINEDNVVDILDCQGPPGPQGEPGPSGGGAGAGTGIYLGLGTNGNFNNAPPVIKGGTSTDVFPYWIQVESYTWGDNPDGTKPQINEIIIHKTIDPSTVLLWDNMVQSANLGTSDLVEWKSTGPDSGFAFVEYNMTNTKIKSISTGGGGDVFSLQFDKLGMKTSTPTDPSFSTILDLVSSGAVFNATQVLAPEEFSSNIRVYADNSQMAGSSTATNHNDWVDVNSFLIASDTPSGAKAGEVVFREMNFTKNLDASSVYLAERAFAASSTPELKFDYCAQSDDTLCGFKIRLENSNVFTGHNFNSVSPNPLDESVNVAFTKFHIELVLDKIGMTPPPISGESAPPNLTKFCWDLVAKATYACPNLP